jgi:hypothetical protein
MESILVKRRLGCLERVSKDLSMTLGGNLRWQTRVRPTAGHRECTPDMATPLDSTSMMKLVVVLAEVNLFPGWLEAGPKSGRQSEPQRGLCSHQTEAPAGTSNV